MFERYFQSTWSPIKKISVIFRQHKVPESKSYPYKVYPQYLVGPDVILGNGLYLVGENWSRLEEKRIALCIGFNDWKFGFVSKYLCEYQTVFCSRKLSARRILKSLYKLNKIYGKVDVVIWGYNDSNYLRFLFRLMNIKVLRVEDGFLRSSSLGSEHSVPLSLVVAEENLYFYARKETSLEKLLNNFDREKENSFLERSSSLIDVFISKELSKYNSPIKKNNLKPKLRRRVVVLGQVKNDASIRYGNPDGWKINQLIELAISENIGSDILYRPHPEVYAGLQKNKRLRKKLEQLVEVLDPSESLISLIERCDQFYTISSLSGFEASLRGKQVTVVGCPFYAGWGFTDDRARKYIERRKNKLSAREVFAISYLKYPRYLADLDDCLHGFDVAMNRIIADRKLGAFQNPGLKFSGNEVFDVVAGFLDCISNNDFKCFQRSTISILSSPEYYQIKDTLLAGFFGLTKKHFPSQLDFMLSTFQSYSSVDVFNRFLLEVDGLVDFSENREILSRMYLKNYMISEAYEQADKIKPPTNLVKSTSEKIIDGNLVESELVSVDETSLKEEDDYQIWFSRKLDIRIEIAEKFDDFQELKTLYRQKLLVCDRTNFATHLLNCAEAEYNTFDFVRSFKLSKLSSRIDFAAQNRKAYMLATMSKFYDNGYNPSEVLIDSLLILKSAPDRYASVMSLFKDSLYDRKIVESSFSIDRDVSLNRLIGLMELSDQYLVVDLFDRIDFNEDSTKKVIGLFVTYLHSKGDTRDAINILEAYLQRAFDVDFCKRLMKLYLYLEEFSKAEALMQILLKTDVEINPTYFIPIYQAQGRIEDAYDLYKSDHSFRSLSFYYPEKFRRSDASEAEFYIESCLILSVYGPGDEIRFSTIYMYIFSRFSGENFRISCDYRLMPLFKRSFPKLNFIPVYRSRSLSSYYSKDRYDQLPSLKLTSILDNNLQNMISDAKNVTVVTDYLGWAVRDGYALKERGHLYPDTKKVLFFREKLKSFSSNKKIIGLSWRSSLNSLSRNEHYLSVEDLLPLFSVPDIQFINLQYDECDIELQYINNLYPGKIINFTEIDQYNDLDTVAALMTCLDIVIAPCTSVAELAGAMGVTTWLFSMSGELTWRKQDSTGRDFWHSELKIVDTPVKGDKSELVQKLRHKLCALVQ